MDPPNRSRRDHYHHHHDHQVLTKRNARRHMDTESSYSSSERGRSRYEESYIPTRHVHTENRYGSLEGESPISSLNSTLSKKLGRLDSSPSNHSLRGRYDDSYEDDRRSSYERRMYKSNSRGSFHDDYVGEDIRHHRHSRSSNSLGRMVTSRSRTNNSFHQDTDRGMGKSRSSRNSNSFHSADYIEVKQLPLGSQRQMRKSRSRPNNSFHDDEYLAGIESLRQMHEVEDAHRAMRHTRQQSSNSLNQRGMSKSRSRTNSSFDEEDDYLVGEEVQINPSPRRRPTANSSYSNLYDDDSDSARDTWSMAKSAFSTLPKRKSFDLYDDESPSLSSRGGWSHSSRKPVSRSSSIHSHLSGQSSHRSQNSRLAKQRMGSFMNSYESDHSMDSLLSGEELEAFDSSSMASDRSESKKRRGVRDASPSNTPSEIEFKLFDLEGLGIEFEASDNEDHADDEASQISELHELPNQDEEERPWWIQHFEEEGLFEYDTSTVYSTKMPAKHQFGRDVHHNLARSMGDALIEEEEKKKAEKVDACDTSTVGLDDDLDDWEERLWTVSRKHYKEYNELLTDASDGASVAKSAAASVPTLSDEMTVEEQEQLFNEDFESEQKGVLMFRSILMACIKAYVEAFHADLSKSDAQKEKTDEATLDPDDGWTELSINLDVDCHVPVVRACGLFEEVIRLIDDGTISLNGKTLDPKTSASTKVQERAEFVASTLLQNELCIFRKYEVITVQDSPLTSAAKQPNRKLMTSPSINTTDAQIDLDAYLYGDADEEEKKDGDDNGLNDRKSTSETRECEIKMRSSLIGKVRGKDSDSVYVGEVSWSNVIGKVILSSIMSKSKDEAEFLHNNEESPEVGRTVASLKHSEPLAELYSLRHAPTFLLRAFAAQHLRGVEETFNVDDLKYVLTNRAYIESRFELQGPYNAVISHLSNFQDQISYHSNIERCKHNDTQDYIALHKLLVSSLHSYLESAVKHTGYKLQRLDADGGVVIDDEEDGNEKSSSTVNIHNYSNTVASCLEVGRALHHLGLCLGRRQRDQADLPEVSTAEDPTEKSIGADCAVSLEIGAYRLSLEAYKACMFIFAEAEQSSGQVGRGELDELQQLREAKMSVELHLADVLTAFGFCHDTKLNEFETALMAYRESISLYIRHIGRFHRIVSNTLHNMGTIHTELEQWSEAASCFRQCLSIIKRKEEQEKTAWIKSHGIVSDEGDELVKNFVSSMNEDIVCTLECLAAALARLGEHDASLVCLEQAMGRMESVEGIGIYEGQHLKIPSTASAELHSQSSNIFMKQASALSVSLNWECHMFLFSDQQKPSSNLRLLLASQSKKEQNAKVFIHKAIMSRRQQCYVKANPYFELSPAATKTQLQSFTEDLVTAGRLEFKTRSYAAALSYLYEALAVHLHSREDKMAFRGLFDKESLKSGGPSLKITDDFVRSTASIVNEGPDGLSMKIFYLIGSSYERMKEPTRAKEVLTTALKVAESLVESSKEKPSLEGAISLVDVATCQLTLAFLSVNVETATTSIQYIQHIIETLNALSKKVNSKEEDDDDSTNSRNWLAILISTQLAAAWHIHGKLLIQDDPARAMKCFQKTLDLLSKNYDERLACEDPTAAWPFSSSLCCEDPSALATATILSDANQYIGEIATDDSLRLSHLQRAITLREVYVSKLGSVQSVDYENLYERFDESQWDLKNMDCYLSLLEILQSRDHVEDNAEEKSIKSHEYDAFDMNMTKEDVLVRLGNLQAKTGHIKDAIKSYQKAETLTVQLLGTRDHEIVSNILFNMGNAYRQLAISSASSDKMESARENAMECYADSIRITSSLFGNRHISLAESLHNQGLLYMGEQHAWFNVFHEERDEDDDHVAMDHLKRSLQIRRKDGCNNLELASTLYLLGNLSLRFVGRTSLRLDSDTSKLANDSISYLVEALKIQTLLLGEDHIDVVNTLHSLGQAHLYRATGSRNKSTKLDGDVAKASESLSSALEALASQTRLTTSVDYQIGKAHCTYLLGCTEKVRCNFSEAKVHFTCALRLLQKVGSHANSLSSESSNASRLETINLLTSRVLEHFGMIHKEEGSLQDCSAFLSKCIQIRKFCKAGKKDGITSASLEVQLARILLEQGIVDESIGNFSHSLRIYLACFGKDSLNVAESLFGMGQAFSTKSRYQKALLCFDKAMRIYEFKEQLTPKEKLGDLHREIGHNLLLSGGDLYEILEHYRSSVSYLEACANELCFKLVTVYTEMLEIMRDVFDAERDEAGKAELLDELCDVLHRLGNLHASSGEHKDAMACFTEVLEIQQRRNADREELRIADLLFNMGNIYVELKRPQKALKCLEESFNITKEALGGDHPELHSTLFLMGVALWDVEDFEGSLEWFTQALSVLNTKTDEEIDDAAKGRTLYRLGQVYEKLGNDSSALSHFQDCAKILKATRSNDAELASALFSMGKLLQRSCDYEDALSCFDQSLRMRTMFGDMPVIASTKVSIGLVLSNMGGQADQSLAYLADALRTKVKDNNSVGVDIGEVLMNIGQIYLSQGQHDLAKNLFETALGAFKGDASNPNQRLNIAVCLYSIGIIQEEIAEDGSLENYLNAIQIFKEEDVTTNTALPAVGLQQYNMAMSKCLYQAAKVYVQKKNYIDALNYMKESYELKKDVFGVYHEETAKSQHWLGIIYLALDEDDLALREFKSALKTRVSLFGTEHNAVAESLYGLAEVHFKRDELPECLECITENLRLYNTQSLGDDSLASRSKLMLGSCYQELGQYADAKENLTEALHMLVHVHGGDRHLDVADAHFRLGICDCECNNFDSSIGHFKTSASIRSSLLGDLDIECANTYESLGIVQQKSALHDEAIASFEKALAIKRASLPEVDEDIGVLLHFIGTSLYAIEKYEEALHFYTSSADIKLELHDSNDQDYAMTLLDKATALTKVGDGKLAMETFSQAIESGLPLDSWELGIAYKYMAKHFYENDDIGASFDSYTEAISIFEWIMENEQPASNKYDDVIECYVHLLDMNDQPISEERGLTCYKLANCYVEVSKLEDAISMYREAVMIQTQIFGVDHVSVANTLHNLGNCYREYGDFDKSEECLTKALGILTLAIGEEHEDVADTCHCLGVTLTSRSEFDEAIPLFERALSIRKKQLGSQHISTASSLYNLALIFQIKGSWISAIKFCKEALKIQTAALGDSNPVTLSTLVCAGRIHYGKGDLENAIKCFRSSFEHGDVALLREIGLIYKDRGESDNALLMFGEAASHMMAVLGLDSDDKDLFSSLNTRKQQTKDQDLIKLADNILIYGSVLVHLNQLNEALSCFRVSNIIYQAKYISSDHLAIADTLYRTGHVLEKLASQDSNSESLNEALDSLTEALRTRRVHLEPSHPDIADTLFTLAKVHHALGNSRDAIKVLAEAVESRGIKNTQFIDVDSLLQIGHMQKLYGKYQEALGTFEECLDIKSRIVGTRHSSIAELQFFMGDILKELGDFSLAESKFNEALAVLEITNSDMINAADVHFSLGILFTEQEKYTLALDSYMKSLQGRKLETTTTKIDMAELLNNIGICYCGMKEYVKAQVYHAEALESLIEELGYDHPDVAFCWHSLGAVHTELNDTEEALKCFKNAVKIERSEIYLQSLGICLVQMHDYEDAYVCLAEALQMKNLDNEADEGMSEVQRNIGLIWMKREKYEEALSMFEQALKIKMTLSPDEQSENYHQHLMECFDGALESVAIIFGSDHLRYAKLLHQKGNIHGAKGEHPLAIEAYIITLRIYKQHYGDSHLSVANSLFNLGVSLNAKGSPDKGLRCFFKALRISKSKLGEDHLDVADTYEQMAVSNKLMLDYAEAITHFEKALSIRKHLTGGVDLKVASIMHEMGVVYLEESNLGSAERAFKESLRLRTSKLGQDDVLIAESMFQLASLNKEQNELTSALKYYEECLRIYKSHQNTPKPIIADIYYSLGGIHSSLGHSTKALCSYNKAESIYCEVHGSKHEKVVSCLARKGRVLHGCGDNAKALSCFSECLERTRLLPQGCATLLSEERAYALSQIGDLYSEMGNVADASSHYSLALAAYKSIHGSGHSAVAEVLQKMASHFVKNEELERGYSCAKEALAVRDRLFGHSDAESNYFMGKILYECGKYSEAMKFTERARKSHTEELGGASEQVADENFLLGMICERKAGANSNPQEDGQNYLDYAVQYLQNALSAKRELLNENDSQISTILTRLGRVHYKLGEYDSAVDCFSECLKLRETNRDGTPATQLLVADALFDLGAALNKALDTKRAMHLFTDALREYQVLLDKNDLNIAKCLGSIGEVHEKENELTEAISYLEKAADIYEQNFGGGEPNEKAIKSSNLTDDYAYQAETLYVLAAAYDRMGDEASSLKLYRNILKIYKALFGRDSIQVAKVLNRLANMKGKSGSVEKAMVLFDESLRIRMLHLGNNHEDVAETLFGMGIVFEKRKNYPAAMKAYSDCLRIRSSRFGSDSMEVAQVVVNIGVVRGNKGDFSGALKSWQKALAIYRKHGLEDDDALVATLLSHQHLASNLIKNRGRSKK